MLKSNIGANVSAQGCRRNIFSPFRAVLATNPVRGRSAVRTSVLRGLIYLPACLTDVTDSPLGLTHEFSGIDAA